MVCDRNANGRAGNILLLFYNRRGKNNPPPKTYNFAAATVESTTYTSYIYNNIMFIVHDYSYLGQRCSGRFDGNFAVVGDSGRDLDRLAGHIGSLVQAHLTLDHAGAQAHGFRQLVIDVAAKRFL